MLVLNTDILQEPLLRQLLNLIPTAEERGLLAPYSDTTENLARADAFFVEV